MTSLAVDTDIELAQEPLIPRLPEKRRKDGRPPGVPVVLSDGLTWQLPFVGLHPVMDPVRDRVFNDVTWSRQASMQDVMLAAWMMLLEDYDLSREEAAELVVVGKDRGQQLVDAVIDAMFGPCMTDGTVEYSQWARGAMLANGLDPEAIPKDMHQVVLGHLVGSGRALAACKVVGSAIALRKRQNLDSPGAR